MNLSHGPDDPTGTTRREALPAGNPVRGRPGGGRRAFLRRGGRRALGPGPGEGLRAGPGEIGDPGLPLGRDVAQRHLGSEARGGV